MKIDGYCFLNGIGEGYRDIFLKLKVKNILYVLKIDKCLYLYHRRHGLITVSLKKSKKKLIKFLKKKDIIFIEIGVDEGEGLLESYLLYKNSELTTKISELEERLKDDREEKTLFVKKE